MFLLLFGGSVFYGLFKRTSISSSSIIIPKGKKLYDIYTVTFRNHTLHRSKSQYLILSEDMEEFESFSFNGKVETDKISILRELHSSSPSYEIMCGGICNCYEENEDERRTMGSVVYSSRYSGYVIVSILGYAVSKFVNDHIDDCYNEARKVLGNENVENGVREMNNRPFMCSMEEVECETERAQVGQGKEEEEEARTYVCEGHCVQSNRKRTADGESAAEQVNCENFWFDKKEMVIRRSGIYRGTTKIEHRESHYTYDQNAWYNTVRGKYRKLYLTPFCSTFTTHYFYKYRKRKRVFKRIRPCNSGVLSQSLKNIRCMRVEAKK